MPGYGQFCPVAVASEVFAERWTPLILRELFNGSRRFSDFRRGMPLISRALLAQRLRYLEDAGVIASAPAGRGRGREYRLTQAGTEFHSVIEGLGAWGQRWVHGRASAENLDSTLLLWNIRRRMAVDRLPERRVVVRFECRGVPGCLEATSAALALASVTTSALAARTAVMIRAIKNRVAMRVFTCMSRTPFFLG